MPAFRWVLARLWLLALVALPLAPRCSVPAAAQARPRPRPAPPAYLRYPLPRPAKVKRDSLGRVIHLQKPAQ